MGRWFTLGRSLASFQTLPLVTVLLVLGGWLRRMTVTAFQAFALLVIVALVPWPAGATVEMQNQAKKLGFSVKNCLDCHASPHSVDKMKAKAKELKMADGNCLACHGATFPIALNDRGAWLVSERGRRGAKECDMAWLKDFKERAPTPKPAVPKASTATPGAKPDAIRVVPKS